MIKPTAYWFVNCEPLHNVTTTSPPYTLTHDTTKRESHPGLCSEARSMISPDYARNFIADFILAGAPQQCDLFEAAGLTC